MNTLRHTQTIAPDFRGMFRLRGSDSSRSRRGRIASRRDTRIILATMNVNAIVIEIQNDFFGNIYVSFAFYDTSNNYLGITTVPMTISDLLSLGLTATIVAAIATAATTNSYTVLSTIWSVGSNPSTQLIQGATHSIVTGTGATGFQISATRNAFVDYSVTIGTTATIGGSASGTVVLEVAPTNSATPSDWVEIARFTNGQSVTLALALQSVQTLAGQLNGMVTAGYYAKLRSINNSGTPTYTYNTGREVLQ